MDYKKIKTTAEKITMSQEVKQRITRNCKEQIINNTEDNYMKKADNVTTFRKPATILVAVVICVALSVTVLGATGVLQGGFRDVFNFRGAVVGTVYENATDEINVSVVTEDANLSVAVNFVNPENPPFEADALGISEYKIVDADGDMVKEGVAESTQIVDGQVKMSINLNDVKNGDYKLIITSFVAEKKADQPMNVTGKWECSFTK